MGSKPLTKNKKTKNPKGEDLLQTFHGYNHHKKNLQSKPGPRCQSNVPNL